MDRLTKWVDQEVQLRLVAVDVLETAREIAHEQHRATGRAAEMIAQSVVGALLLASDLKTMTTLSLQVLLEGSLRMVCADATPEALVRAMAPKDDLDAFDPSQKLHPYRLVVRRVGSRGVQYQSVVEGRTDTLAQALASYVRQSDQQPCALGIQVATDEEGQLTRAFGFLLQGFPDTREAVLQACEIAISFADPFTVEESGHDWLMRSLALREWDPLQERRPAFFCPCTRERAARSLVVLGAAELEEAAAGQEELEVFCDFCRRRYMFTDSELLDLAFEAQSAQDEREVAEAEADSEPSGDDSDSLGEGADSASLDEDEDDADDGPIKPA